MITLRSASIINIILSSASAQIISIGLLRQNQPQTLAFALNDSPVGLASWIVEKFRSWSDCDGTIENVITRDELLTNITLYWATGTINSASWPYYVRGLAEGNPASAPLHRRAFLQYSALDRDAQRRPFRRANPTFVIQREID